MGDEDYFSQLVAGLSSSYITDSNQEGWVYICKTKAGNRGLWLHYFKEVLIPIITKSRECHRRANTVSPDGAPLPFSLKCRPMLTSDGEAIIMNTIFTDTVLSSFRDAEIDYLKLGPSCTKIQQPWDAGTLFRDAKGGLNYCVAQGYEVRDERFRVAMFGSTGKQSKELGYICEGVDFFSALFNTFPNPTLKAFWTTKQQERLVYSLELIKKVCKIV